MDDSISRVRECGDLSYAWVLRLTDWSTGVKYYWHLIRQFNRKLYARDICILPAKTCCHPTNTNQLLQQLLLITLSRLRAMCAFLFAHRLAAVQDNILNENYHLLFPRRSWSGLDGSTKLNLLNSCLYSQLSSGEGGQQLQHPSIVRIPTTTPALVRCDVVYIYICVCPYIVVTLMANWCVSIELRVPDLNSRCAHKPP